MRTPTLVLLCVVIASVCLAADDGDLKMWKDRAAKIKKGMLRGDVERLLLTSAEPLAAFRTGTIEITLHRTYSTPVTIRSGLHQITTYQVGSDIFVGVHYDTTGETWDAYGNSTNSGVSPDNRVIDDATAGKAIAPKAPAQPH